MAKVNENYFDLKESYLFSEIAHRVDAYIKKHENHDIIRMGIGDVTLPLCDEVVKAMQDALLEMGYKDSFHGYGPEQGYAFLREKIKDYYKEKNVKLNLNEIFISDGAKSDLGNILDLFSKENIVLIPDPVYPVYVDTNIMDGRKIIYAQANEGNEFLPIPDYDVHVDIIYICSPNNPTGAVYTKRDLMKWVEYAISNNAIILYDAAYESFINDSTLPRSIYEIPNASKCAIEFCSFSKMAGFTGVRCGFTIVPNELMVNGSSLNKMWLRRQTTKFNGVGYVVQKGASAIFSEEGKKEIGRNIRYYLRNAKVITDTLDELDIWYVGGKYSPYVWFKCPNGMDSWKFFDYLLENVEIVGTPGAGFGKNGESFFRLSAFSSYEQTIKAMNRMRKLLQNI